MSQSIPIPIDVKQRVVVCIDLTEDEDETAIGFGDTAISVEKVVRQAVCQFVRLKSLLDSETEFTVVGMLNSKAKCVLEFSKNIDIVTSTIEGFPSNKPSKPAEVNMDEFLFPILDDTLKDYFPTESPDGVPSHVCQVIIVYKSSYRVPNMNKFDFALFKTPGVMIDVLYVHDIPSHDNHIDIIFESLNRLNVSGNSYILECLNTQITTIYNTMSFLLAHPAQRTPQKYLNSDLRYILSDRQEKDSSYNGELRSVQSV